MPVPDNGALSGLEEALVVKTNAPFFTPDDEGANVTLTEQFPPAASVPPHVFAEIAKSVAPVRTMPVIASVADPLFVSVITCGLVVTPTMTLPKETLDGLRTTAGNAGLLAA